MACATDSRVLRTAAHEARHACLASYVSLRIDYVTIDPRHPAIPDGSVGYTRSLTNDGQINVFDRLLIDLAGYMDDDTLGDAWPPSYEAARDGERIAPGNHDLHQVGRSLRLLREGGLTEEQTRAAYIEACSHVRQVLDDPAFRRAHRVIVLALLRHRSLSGDDVAILLGDRDEEAPS